MNQQELSKYIDSSFITWESIKLTLLSTQNISFILGRQISDESILLKGVFIFSPPSDTSISKPYVFNIPSNQFFVLLTSNKNQFSVALSYDLVGTPILFQNASIGTIFVNSFSTSEYNSESATFLIFQIN